ncbi:MAG TPA: glutamine-hydrolyzing carbamoyl-phosphate synthase small subunit [Gemmatimonadota bacterium]|nr:glutamine-hydrolyzing carbamoyl-phosphate synthase small subunit [Gemmatimonadota bacterium]
MIERPARLALEDGWTALGRAVGSPGSGGGECVFNTCLSGYQEVLTDPSYAGQIVVMTYPLIGNYGITAEDSESSGPQVAGFVVRECVRRPSNWRAVESLPAYLERHAVTAIEGIDTRALTRHLRVRGALRGVITTEDLDAEAAIQRARSLPLMEGQDLTGEVTCAALGVEGAVAGRLTVAALDYGLKQNILRRLGAAGCRVLRLPADATAEDALALRPDGLFISNGPGDPAAASRAIETLRQIGRRAPDLPTFGICLGHQLLALAHGGSTYKLKFGHHGGNHPVQDLRTREIDITSHNHGFSVREATDGARRIVAGAPELEVTHVNLYDGTLEGFRHVERPLFAVQYHPEAAPGPHDARHHFDEFVAMIESRRGEA